MADVRVEVREASVERFRTERLGLHPEPRERLEAQLRIGAGQVGRDRALGDVQAAAANEHRAARPLLEVAPETEGLVRESRVGRVQIVVAERAGTAVGGRHRITDTPPLQRDDPREPLRGVVGREQAHHAASDDDEIGFHRLPRALGRAELLDVGDRPPEQRSVEVHGVAAHPAQRRRVGVDRDGRGVAVLAHAVDVGRVEVEHVARAMAEPAGRATQHEALLDELALHDGDRAARDVVVVEACVVAVRLRDHPHIHVVVAPQLLEVALAGVVAYQRSPPPRVGGDGGHQLAQLAPVAIAVQRRRVGEFDHAPGQGRGEAVQ